MPGVDYFLLLLLLLGGITSILTRKLTPIAAAAGVLLGGMIYKGCGYTGIAMLAAFFIMGTAATAWGIGQKLKNGLAEEKEGRRTAGQVMANAGVAGLAGLASLIFIKEETLFQLMIAGCFSAAAADTLSSELGNVYGRRFLNVLSFKKDQRGLNGVVSPEGTLCGLAGSAVIAGIYCSGFGWNRSFFWILLSGTIGNLADSVLGATVERRGWLGNNGVNFLNTLVGAVIAAAAN